MLESMKLYTDASRMDAVGASFARDIAGRIGTQQGLPAVAAPESAENTDLTEKDARLQGLENALAETVSYMKNTHGEKAASAMIGLVYKRLGEGEINEQSLGNAFLDVTRFIDTNFGTDAGDGFLQHLNGSLNETMNAFFDNGLNENFFVATNAAGGGGADASAVLEDLAKQYAETIKKMLQEARTVPEDGNSPQAVYGASGNTGPLPGAVTDLLV